MLLKKFMNCVTFYKNPNSILNDKTYSTIIGSVSVLVCTIFFNYKIYFSLVEQQRLLMKLGDTLLQTLIFSLEFSGSYYLGIFQMF